MEKIPKFEKSLNEMTRAELQEKINLLQGNLADCLTETEQYSTEEKRNVAKARARQILEDLMSLTEVLGENKRNKVREMEENAGLKRNIPEPEVN